MIGILIGWTFASFLYFKVAFDSLFNESISIVAALLLAVMVGVYVLIGSYLQANQLLRYNWSPGAVPAKLSELVAKTLISFLALSAVFVLISRAIIFGFSKNLSSDIKLLTWRGGVDESVIMFLIIVLVPLFLHYAMSLFGTYNNANASRNL